MLFTKDLLDLEDIGKTLLCGSTPARLHLTMAVSDSGGVCFFALLVIFMLTFYYSSVFLFISFLGGMIVRG